MRYTTLPIAGLRISRIGLGCNSFGGAVDAVAARALVATAREHGVTLFDTADAYHHGESERLLGRALRGADDEIVIATKVGHARTWRRELPIAARVSAAVEDSVRRLGRVDLCQLHAPTCVERLDEAVAALAALVEAGTIRAWGLSNLASWQLADAWWTARTAGAAGPATLQATYNLIDRDAETELLPACVRFGVGLLATLPLARGVLSGKHPRGARREGRRVDAYLTDGCHATVTRLGALAREHGIPLPVLALGSLLPEPGVAAALVGATSPAQLRENVLAADWDPPRELRRVVDVLAPEQRPPS